MNMQTISAILEIVGLVGSVLTVAGTLFPATSKVGQFCARFGADLKGVHAPKADQ